MTEIVIEKKSYFYKFKMNSIAENEGVPPIR